MLGVQSDADDGGMCLQFVVLCVDFAGRTRLTHTPSTHCPAAVLLCATHSLTGSLDRLCCLLCCTVRFSWRLLEWSDAQLQRLEGRSDIDEVQLRTLPLPRSITAAGLPRYCLGCTAEERPHRWLDTCRFVYTRLASKYMRAALRVQQQQQSTGAGGEQINKPLNTAVLVGQSKVELCHPAGTAVITL